jgi:hypothetical protein
VVTGNASKVVPLRRRDRRLATRDRRPLAAFPAMWATEARRANRHMCGSPPGAFKQKIGIESQDFSNPSLLDA